MSRAMILTGGGKRGGHVLKKLINYRMHLTGTLAQLHTVNWQKLFTKQFKKLIMMIQRGRSFCSKTECRVSHLQTYLDTSKSYEV